MPMSWNPASGGTITLGEGEVLFTLQFRAKQAVVSEVRITGSQLSKEAYTDGLELLDIETGHATVQVDGATSVDPNAVNGYYLLQNEPNPFRDETTIRFKTPNAEAITFTVVNNLGQVVWESTGEYLPGEHQLLWNGKTASGDRVASGTYYCRMTTATYQGLIKLNVAD